MLKEYINKLQEENNNNISSLEQEMSEHMSDLSCSEQLLDKLEQEKMLDTNIFSPRTIDSRVSEQLNQKQKDVRDLKQKIEYVSQRLEECYSNRNKYFQMEAELDKSVLPSGSDTNTSETQLLYEKNQTELSSSKYSKISLSDELDISQSDSIDLSQNKTDNDEIDYEIDNSDIQNIDVLKNMIVKQEVDAFLKSITKKLEHSISLLNGNKNRCRSEIQSVIKSIQEFEGKNQK